MKDQMQYIVIEGRKPQDGAKPTQALLILPKWISPTLACAGIVGRVIELTDGNIIEQGAVFMGEQETLESLRIDIQQDSESQQGPSLNQMVPDYPTPEMEVDDRHEQELQAEGVTAPVASDLTDEAIDALAESMPGGVLGFMKDWGYRQFAREVQARYTGPYSDQAANARIQQLETELKTYQQVIEAFDGWQPPGTSADDAYRQGMQATRDKLAGLLLQFGMPTDVKVPNWLKEQLEELAQFRLDRPETLAKLQAAEDNLDAWRDAAGANPRIKQYTNKTTGRIERLAVAVMAGEEPSLRVVSPALLRANNRYYSLQRAIAEVMMAGQDYIDKGGLAE